MGHRHTLSAALLIGGKDVAYEKRNVHAMNILVCTPGRRAAAAAAPLLPLLPRPRCFRGR